MPKIEGMEISNMGVEGIPNLRGPSDTMGAGSPERVIHLGTAPIA